VNYPRGRGHLTNGTHPTRNHVASHHQRQQRAGDAGRWIASWFGRVVCVLKGLLLSLVFLSAASAQNSLRYRCPKGNAMIPASCLEDMKVDDVSRSLSIKERHQLAYLFAKSHLVSIVKYKQDYYVDPDAPISRLLTTNFPELVKLRSAEGGIWLRPVFNFFRSRSEYKVDVERALRELPAKKRRQFAR
jgi:hypothetical protein